MWAVINQSRVPHAQAVIFTCIAFFSNLDHLQAFEVVSLTSLGSLFPKYWALNFSLKAQKHTCGFIRELFFVWETLKRHAPRFRIPRSC